MPHMLAQELRSYLHTHRTWLAGLLSSSSSNAGHNGVCNQSQLLSRMLSGLLKCCDPEVRLSILHPVRHSCKRETWSPKC